MFYFSKNCLWSVNARIMHFTLFLKTRPFIYNSPSFMCNASVHQLLLQQSYANGSNEWVCPTFINCQTLFCALWQSGLLINKFSVWFVYVNLILVIWQSSEPIVPALNILDDKSVIYTKGLLTWYFCLCFFVHILKYLQTYIPFLLAVLWASDVPAKLHILKSEHSSAVSTF